MSSGGALKMPASEPRQNQPSRVSSQRPGRRPLRSSVAPSERAVGEDDGRGAVPGLEQARVVVVEVRELRRGRRAGPSTAAGSSSSSRAGCERPESSEQLEDAVEGGGVGAPRRSSGRQRSSSSPRGADSSTASRARIQLALPRSVLISPLWETQRSGWASSQLGAVLVEKREWTTASVVISSGSRGPGRRRRASTPSACPCRRRCGRRSSRRRARGQLALGDPAGHEEAALEVVGVVTSSPAATRSWRNWGIAAGEVAGASSRPGRRASRSACVRRRRPAR